MRHFVPFITVETGCDLLVSFLLDEHAERSLTLLRTPQYELLLPEDERGVSVGTGMEGSIERELLVSIDWATPIVRLTTTARRDLSRIVIFKTRRAHRSSVDHQSSSLWR